jgi:DNA-binding beta-propeller fold protein YncE
MASRHLWPIIGIPVLLIAMSGCGSGSPPEFLYLVSVSASPNSPVTQSLSSFKVDSSTGALSPTSTIMLGSEAGIAVDPASRFLYLTDPPVIDIFSIDPTTGAPTGNGGLLLTVIGLPSSGPGALAFAPSGKFLYYGSSTVGLGAGGVVQGIGALAVNSATGELSTVSGSPFPADQVPISVLVHPSGQFVYTENAALSPGLPYGFRKYFGICS